MAKAKVRPGYKTTEFWLTLAADVCGVLMISGVLTDGSMWGKIVGGAITVLATLGYQASRSKAKAEK